MSVFVKGMRKSDPFEIESLLIKRTLNIGQIQSTRLFQPPGLK